MARYQTPARQAAEALRCRNTWEREIETSEQKRLLRSLDGTQQEAVSLLSEWVRVDSTNGREGQFQDMLAAQYEEAGLEVDKFELDLEQLRKHPGFYESRAIKEGVTYQDRPNVVGVYSGGSGRSLLFNGHSDTMFLGARELWNIDPFSGEVKDGRLYGRGSSDMKCGIAAAFAAFRAVRQAGIKLRGDVTFTNVVDEEQSSNGSLACVLRGYGADAGINLEGTENRICPSQSGGVVFRIRLPGASGSVLRETQSLSAIDVAYKLYAELKHFAAMRPKRLSHDLIDPNTIGLYVAWFHAGTWNNMLPTEAVLEGTFRYLPNERQQAVKEKLIDFVNRVADRDDFLRQHRPEVSFYQTWEASEIDPDHPIVKTMRGVYPAATGTSGVLGGREGGTDAWVFTKHGGTPTLSYGPGLNDMMHVADEYVLIADYLESVRVLAFTMAEWCGT